MWFLLISLTLNLRLRYFICFREGVWGYVAVWVAWGGLYFRSE